jgi:hypothetical protein
MMIRSPCDSRGTFDRELRLDFSGQHATQHLEMSSARRDSPTPMMV